MTKAAKNSDEQETGMIRHIPLSQLDLSPMNPRRNVADEEITALADSIRTVGLLQNLAGIEAEAGRVEIVAGGRRLQALFQIADESGNDRAMLSIPVRITKSAAEAQAWAATENEAREALNTADEIRAYAAMSATGSSPQTIARAFAVTVRHVKGRLKLAALPDPILDALGAGEITLDAAAAYTVSADPARQLETFEKLSGTWNLNSDYHIRRLLTDDAADQESQLARFVGREAYEAAGGAISENLFGDEVYFLDGDVLARLAEEKLEAEADAIRADGWKWVEASLENKNHIYSLPKTYPAPVAVSEEDTARFDELTERVEADAASEEEHAELSALSETMNRHEYSNEQKALAGVFLYPDYRGDMTAHYGMVRHEDLDAAIEAGICQANRHMLQTNGTEPQEPKPAYSAALAEDMARIRTGAVQAALLDKPELVLDLLAFALSTKSYGGAIPLAIRADMADGQPKDGEGMKLPDALTARTTPVAWLKSEQAAKTFAAFRAKPKKERNAVLTECIARAFSIGLAGKTENPLAEAIAEQAGAKPRNVWTPTEAFLKRLTAAQLDVIHAEIMGEVSEGFAKMKKGEKVLRLHRIFAGADGIPPLSAEQKSRVAAWLPEGMTPAPREQADSPANETAA